MKQARKERQTDKAAKYESELKGVELKRGTEHLLQIFNALDSGRAYDVIVTMGGGTYIPRAIPQLELEAFCRLRDIELTPWEAETISLMDRVFREESAKLRG